MAQGLPPKPTCLSIVGGILLAGLVLAAFALLPNLVKWLGAAFTFLPSRLGLLQVVAPDEVMRVDMAASPTDVAFERPGDYALFTSNYDLLSINEAVLAAHAKPWFRLGGGDGSDVAVSLIERGLAFYDTPFASGRPVARFSITSPGTYSMTHPRRPDFVFVVPDYTSGKEGAISIYMLLQLVALGVGGLYVRRKTRRPLRRVLVPPPSRLNREKLALQIRESERPTRSAPTRPWQPDPALAASVAEPKPDDNVRDLLRMLHQDEMTLQQVEAEVEAKFLAQPAGRPELEWGASLALTPPETAAYSQGAGMGDLLTLRYQGWPSACARCGQPIEHEQLRWWFVRDERGRPGLRHIDCPPKKT